MEELGFTVFGIEATMPEAFDINEYVLTGRGDPEKALAGLYFWTWNTEEVLEMIEWMRLYNADPRHSRKVKFYGFDMQSAPRAVRVTLDYLGEVDPELAALSAERLQILANPYTARDFTTLPPDQKKVIAEAVGTIAARLDEKKDDFVAKTSDDEWAIAAQHTRIIGQYTEMTSLFPGGFAVRDRSMAENIRWILDTEGPGAKMAIWAHNGHVATQPLGGMGGIDTMGVHLRRMFGDDLVVFGFAFNQGAFQAIDSEERGLRSFTVEPAPDGSLDNTLAAAGLSLAAVNLRGLPNVGLVADWFSQPRPTRSIGAVFSDETANVFLQSQVVSGLYDALLFVETTAAARANPGAAFIPRPQKLASPRNLGFEDSQVGEQPKGWDAPASLSDFDFHVSTTAEQPYEGDQCAAISRTAGAHYGETYGKLTQTLDATPYRGKRIRLRVAVRTEVEGSNSQAYVWLRVLEPGVMSIAKPLFYENMADAPIRTNEWRETEIIGDVSEEADTIDYGLALIGEGKAWIDAVTVEAIDP